tara:strand:+ start:705 stop:1841 length:1137 start_codon:yes stop_codon:yes gene_type:complete
MNLLSQLDSFKNNQKIINFDQSTNDIINAIVKQHNKSEKDYDKLFYFFDCGNYYDTAKKVFNFLKNNIKYQIEPDQLQTVKSPAAILATKKGDCKHYSLFQAGILDSYRRNTGEKFDLCYRFASYDKSKTPEHVFVVINPGSKNEIYCDAVLDYFNEKKEPNFYKDKKITNMALMALSGINQRSQMNGVLELAGGLVPGGGTIVEALKTLSRLIPGHSDYYFYDTNYVNGKLDLVIAQAVTWYNKGISINQFDFSRIWSDTATKIPPTRRIDMLLDIYNKTKDQNIIPIINAAVDNKLLPASARITSSGAPGAPGAPGGSGSFLSNLFKGGSTQNNPILPGEQRAPGAPSATNGISTTLLIGGAAAAALIAFLIFKKK